MSNFIKKTFIATLILTIVFSGIYLLNKHFFYSYHQAAFGEVENIILGGSRSMDIDPLMMKNGLNVADFGQTHKVVYYQLKFFSEFCNLENALISYSSINFGHSSEKSMNEEYHSIKRIYPYASPVQLYQSTGSIKYWFKVVSKYIFSFNLEYFGKYLKVVVLGLPINDRQRDEENSVIDLDYYKSSKAKRVERAEGYIQLLFVDENLATPQEIAPLTNKYLLQIADLCQEKNIQLHLINMPLDPVFRERIPKEFKEKFNATTTTLIQQYGAKYHNYESYTDQTINRLFDPIHATPSCAKTITKEILPLLK